MYSYEIQEELEIYNYNLSGDDYIRIIDVINSPQICHVKYNAYENYFEAWTTDNYYWKFTVYYK